jgi:hypothetical protein
MALGWRKEYLRYREYFLNIVVLYKQRPNVRMFLEIMLSLATISFFSAFALRPTLLTIAQLLNEIEAKEEVIAKLDTKIENIGIAEGVYTSEAPRIPFTVQSVPTNPSVEILTRQVEALAVANQVNLLGVSFGEVVLAGEEKQAPRSDSEISPLPEGAAPVTFSISVTGSYQSLFNFLSSLENLRRPIRIDTTGMTASVTEEGKKIVLLVSGRVPYLKN